MPPFYQASNRNCLVPRRRLCAARLQCAASRRFPLDAGRREQHLTQRAVRRRFRAERSDRLLRWVVWELSSDRSRIIDVHALGNLSATSNSAAVGVNNRGQVTGNSPNGQIDSSGYAVYRPYRIAPQDTDGDTLPDTWFVADTMPGSDPYKNLLMEDLGTLGGERSEAKAINGLGQVAGGARNSAGYDHPVLWTEGAITGLGTVPGTLAGVARGLNGDGQVVGECQGKAFVWDAARGIRDLNAVKAADDTSGLNLMTAYAISANGRIVGRGQGKGKSYPPPDRAFIAVPQP